MTARVKFWTFTFTGFESITDKLMDLTSSQGFSQDWTADLRCSRAEVDKKAVEEHSEKPSHQSPRVFAGVLPKLPHLHSPCSPSSETMGRRHVFKGEVATRTSSRTARHVSCSRANECTALLDRHFRIL